MNEAEVTRLLEQNYRASVFQDNYPDGSPGYVASHPELDGCIAVGSTPQEALAELEKARESYIRALVKAGVEVPTPAPAPEMHGAFQAQLKWNWIIYGSPGWDASGVGLQRAETDLGEAIARPLYDFAGAA